MPSFYPSKGTDGPWVDPSLGDAQALGLGLGLGLGAHEPNPYPLPLTLNY